MTHKIVRRVLFGAASMIALGSLSMPAAAGDGECIDFVFTGTHSISRPFILNSIEIEGTRAYFANQLGTVEIFNISDDGQLELLESGSVGGSYFPVIQDIQVRDSIVFAGVTSGDSSTSGLYVLDTTDLASITRTGNNTLVDMGHFVLAGDFIYGVSGLFTNQRLLYVLDVSDLSAPLLLSQTTLPNAGGLSKLDVVGDMVYLALDTAGLVIYDASDPSAPVFVGSFDTSGNAQDVLVDGSIAFLGDGPDGLKVFDVQDPSNPTLLMSYPSLMNLGDLKLDGTIMYGISPGLGVQAFDVNDVLMIETVGMYMTDIDREINGMAVQDNIVITTSTSTAPGPTFDRLDVLEITNTCDHDCPSDRECPADMNGDGHLNAFDVAAFIGFFGAQDLQADLECDGVLNFFDISAFLISFRGCP